MLKTLLAVLLSLLVLSSHASTDVVDNRIKGVSEFLLERANDNWLYVVEAQIKDNALFSCYFPNTYKQMTSGNLKLLLSAGNEVWAGVVEEDLKGLGSRYMVRVLASEKFSRSVDALRDKYISAVLQRFDIEHNGKRYPIDQLPLNADAELKTAVNRFSNSLSDAFAAVESLKQKARLAGASRDCSTQPSLLREANDAVKKMEAAVRDIRINAGQLLPRTGLSLGGSSLDEIATGADLDELLIRLLALDSAELSDLFDLSQMKTAKNYTMRVLEAEAILSRLSELGLAPIELSPDSKAYARFRRYVLSVAVLSDAESSDQVKVALQEMTLPPVSFGLKRQPEESTVMLTSYLGLSAGMERNDEDGNSGIYGLFAPVGLEYSYGLSNKRSLSLVLAPLDFAYPLSLELNDQKESVEWQDIVRPSLSLTYGLKDYPIAIGFAVSRGRPLTSDADSDGGSDGKKETQYFIFVAFDMPLFQVF
ncbi:hypothetical protein HPT27_11915 [Permianibacter sp. IMCC34836]|uniref:hypothetical protein n=1 Tax=Permianibacter fluminis TaxID=2738515 RepID=UPI0015543831|nr:hypothetical protein [Permianibacter fluminis]NQD37733.1 hypothetical protein [Permianibacter fluminis]